jgi:hypothetical protein
MDNTLHTFAQSIEATIEKNTVKKTPKHRNVMEFLWSKLHVNI